MLTREQKETEVRTLSDKFSRATSVFLADYRGLDVKATDELRKSFNVYENTVSALYEACKPEVLSRSKGRMVSAFQYLRGVMDTIVEQADVDSAVRRLGELLDLARDFGRLGVWERNLRKIGFPVAYSEGFSPRPKLSFGLALPTGAGLASVGPPCTTATRR